MLNKEYNLAFWIQALILFKLKGKIDDIIKITRFFQEIIYALKPKAIKQKYNLVVLLQLTNNYLKIALKPGSLSISLKKKKEMLFKIITDCDNQKKIL